MKILIEKLKTGALLSVLTLLFCCMGDATVINNTNMKAFMIKSAGQILELNITGDQLPISKFVHVAGLAKISKHPKQIIPVLPISFGTADAILISN